MPRASTWCRSLRKAALLLLQLFQQLLQQGRRVLIRRLGGHAVHLHGAATEELQVEAHAPQFGQHVLHQRQVRGVQFHVAREELRLADARALLQQLQVAFVQDPFVRPLLVHHHETAAQLGQDVGAVQLEHRPLARRARPAPAWA